MGSLNEGFISKAGDDWMRVGESLRQVRCNLVGRVRQQEIRIWAGDSI
jgi:translation initiation factor IF-1